MASLSLSHIYKVYPNGKTAVKDFSMDIADNEFIVFVGPSGCGKSTTLRMIAGLEEITAGELRIGDKIVNDVEPKDRDIAMVFQNYALYPHMTVYQNMAFALRLRKMSKEEIDKKVRDAAEILGMTEYLNKKPKEMSGGQRQRVALGRAIVRQPKVMLLDEPLSNLDAKLRTAMRSEISKLHNKLKTTFIYVTHDQVEAMTMGTRIVVMKDGVIQQVDSPRNLYRFPCNKFVAGFIGTPQMNFFDGKLLAQQDGVLITLDNTPVEIKAPLSLFDKAEKSYLDGTKRVVVGLRAENISVDPEAFPFRAKCRVSHVEELGTDCQIYADLNLQSEDTVAESPTRVIVKAPSGSNYETDSVIEVSLDLSHMQLFDAETEQTLLPRVPQSVALRCNVVGRTLDISGNKINLPSAFDVAEGEAQLILPTDAVTLDGNIHAELCGSEDVNGKTLLHLRLGDNVLFAFADSLPSSKIVSLGVDLKRVELVRDGQTIHSPLNLVNRLAAQLTRRKESVQREVKGKTKNVMQWAYFLQTAGVEIPLSEQTAQRVGTDRMRNTALEVQFDPYSVVLGEEGIAAEVQSIADFGTERFALCKVGDEIVNVSVGKDFDAKQVHFTLQPQKISIVDTTRDIRLI